MDVIGGLPSVLPTVFSGLRRALLLIGLVVFPCGEVGRAVLFDGFRHFQNDVAPRFLFLNDIQDVGAGGRVRAVARPEPVNDGKVLVAATVVRIVHHVRGAEFLHQVVGGKVVLAAADINIGVLELYHLGFEQLRNLRSGRGRAGKLLPYAEGVFHIVVFLIRCHGLLFLGVENFHDLVIAPPLLVKLFLILEFRLRHGFLRRDLLRLLLRKVFVLLGVGVQPAQNLLHVGDHERGVVRVGVELIRAVGFHQAENAFLGFDNRDIESGKGADLGIALFGCLGHSLGHECLTGFFLIGEAFLPDGDAEFVVGAGFRPVLDILPGTCRPGFRFRFGLLGFLQLLPGLRLALLVGHVLVFQLLDGCFQLHLLHDKRVIGGERLDLSRRKSDFSEVFRVRRYRRS